MRNPEQARKAMRNHLKKAHDRWAIDPDREAATRALRMGHGDVSIDEDSLDAGNPCLRSRHDEEVRRDGSLTLQKHR